MRGAVWTAAGGCPSSPNEEPGHTGSNLMWKASDRALLVMLCALDMKKKLNRPVAVVGDGSSKTSCIHSFVCWHGTGMGYGGVDLHFACRWMNGATAESLKRIGLALLDLSNWKLLVYL